LILYIGDCDPITKLNEWRIHIDSAWRIDTSSSPVVGSLDLPTNGEPIDRFVRALNSIRDATIESIAVASPVLDLAFQFSNGCVLRSFAHFSDGEHWELRHSSGLRLSMANMVNVDQHQDSPDTAAT
jgi:hypothetical protein